MLSRVADNLYWMSRYLERAEHAARLLDVNLNLMLDESASSADRRWRRVLAALGNPPNLAWSGDAYQVAQILTFDPGNRSSITACIAAARENARQVREEISTDQWQRLNYLFHQVTRHKTKETDDVLPSDFLLSVIEGVHLFQGVTDSTMSHGEGWHFIRVGRYIERACATATILGLYHRSSGDSPIRLPKPASIWNGSVCFGHVRRSKLSARSTRLTSVPTASSSSFCSTRNFPTHYGTPSTACTTLWKRFMEKVESGGRFS